MNDVSTFIEAWADAERGYHHRPMERPGQCGRASHPRSGPGDARDRQGPKRLATREHPLQLHRRNRRSPR